MDQLIDVNRAARLAGVTRVEIQRQIASGLLQTFEGRVKMSDLVGLYPEIDESRSYMLEVVSQIKEDAVGKAVRRRDGSMPQDLSRDFGTRLSICAGRPASTRRNAISTNNC
jgi:CDP-4-dehydro-6-deoxyglucose reductase